ncbi:MAG: indolepyruvate ferredoxin oxidoreductase family protein [Rhodobacteraceae bacterium]|nr:indolepyruvate ferredoxin oxidoreductase family protein [Paracoccaceae bacterium]
MSVNQPDRPQYQLSDRYTALKGRIFLTGTQALVRILLDQGRRDRQNGLKTGGFVSGYRGSPLGALDTALWQAGDALKDLGIEFLPAVNEDLAATAVLGSQQAETQPGRQVEGVYGMWYGKGPGVDRAGDALRHGNAYGSSPHGGVLVVAGDDHGCVSSSMSHQSDVDFMSWFMPTLNPASVAEYLEFGAYGYALSRFSGMWVGFKAISETVESAQSLEIPPERVFRQPDFTPPAAGLHYRWPDLPGPQIEQRFEDKKEAVLAFAEANPIDRVIYGVKNARFGIVTTGKGHLDLMEALRLLGVDQAACHRLGIEIYKVGMVWPLARHAALDFVSGKDEVVVVEEKRGIIESQLKEYFYNWSGVTPKIMVGKQDGQGKRLIPWIGELSPRLLLPLIAGRLDRVFPDQGFVARAAALATPPILLNVTGASRTPYFCSGCPHNTSTKVPEGSSALAGIGCHFMASWMDRNTSSLIQMGGEGVNWAASSRFTGHGHVFQNLGEGTWYHSGSMAIRQSIAAKANITYKILYNDAVAMTGGQPVDGPISVPAIAQICRAEGVNRIALVSDDPGKFRARDFPVGVSFDHRRDLDRVQRELREVKGVSVLIYEQTCATEKRRRRKRGLMEDPKKFVMINPLVCEGCGDCSVESNCLSVEPLETRFGRKRRINLSTCNKDFSCLNGFCPSFVTLEGAVRKKKDGAGLDAVALATALPKPAIKPLERPYDLLVTGVGGTGVVTIGALISMAAHMEGLGASVLDFTGFAQKFGTVLGYVRLGPRPDSLCQVRIDDGSADAVIGCDIVVASAPKASATYRRGTRIVLNVAEMPTGDLVRSPDASLKVDERVRVIADAVGVENLAVLDANKCAEKLLGDSVFANMMMLGHAWQIGLVPVGFDALAEAIELNGVAPAKNHAAFAFGRILAADPARLAAVLGEEKPKVETLEQLVASRQAFLGRYQNAAYGQKYADNIAAMRRALPADWAVPMMVAAARSLFKLMAYKDEYEVARLHRQPEFAAELAAEFQPGFKLKYHMAPPLLSRKKDARGRPRKKQFGAGTPALFGVLARLKSLRATPFDPFGYSAERRMERELIGWFEGIMSKAANSATQDTVSDWIEILGAPMRMRGYGPVKLANVEKVRAEMTARLT